MSTDTPSAAEQLAEQARARGRAIFATEIPEVDVDAYSPAEPRNAAREQLVAQLSPEQITRVAAREERTERLYSRGTPVRNLRLDDDRWAAVQAEAAATGSTASDVIRSALDAYLDRRP